MEVELYHTTCELKKLFRNEQNPRIAARIRAVYLALMDKTAPEIGCLLGYSRRTIQNWIHAYNRQGIEGLKESSGRGNKSKLNEDQIQWLRQRNRLIERSAEMRIIIGISNCKINQPYTLFTEQFDKPLRLRQIRLRIVLLIHTPAIWIR